MMNNKVVAIVKNEVERAIKNRWFVILNLILLFTIVIGINFTKFKQIFKNSNLVNGEQVIVYVEDKEKIAFETLQKELAKDTSIASVEKVDTIDVYSSSDIASNVLLVKVQKDSSKYIAASISTKEAINERYIIEIEATLNSLKDSMILANKNLTADEIKAVKEDITLDRIYLGENVTEESDYTYFLKFLSTYGILFVLTFCLTKIANTISQEKLSKSIEYILTSISVKQYMISKVLSICLVVLIQFVFMLAYGVISVFLNVFLNRHSLSFDGAGTLDITAILTTQTVWYFIITIVFMILTTFLLGMIQSVLSAKTTNIQESGNTTMLLLVINFICYFLVLRLVSPEKTVGILGYLFAILPISSMYFIPSMFLINQVNTLVIILSLIVLVAIIPLVVILTQKQFKNSILDFIPKHGKEFSAMAVIQKTREYQEKLLERKEGSKKGLAIGLSIILLILIQLFGGVLLGVGYELLINKYSFARSSNLYLLAQCLLYIISIGIPYLIIKTYIPDEEKNKKEKLTPEEKKKDLNKTLRYMFLAFPVMSVIQTVCSFAVEKMGMGGNITQSLGLFNYTGKIAAILLFIQVAVLPAIFEELFCRKGVLGMLKNRGTIFATVLSSFIFAIVHLNISQFVFAFLVGILFAVVRMKTGKLYPTIILHFINNALALIQVLFYKHMIFMQLYTFLIIGINAIGFCILIYMAYKKVMELKDKESIQKLKEEYDIRKIKINLSENLYVIRDFTFVIAMILSLVIFIAVERLLSVV